MKKLIVVIGSILIITLSLLVFIYFSNDHFECENISTIKTTADGAVVKTVEHVCKEKYNY